ncbi:MAG: NAD(+)/NADH kinase [Abditibacteriales bacterium]|nr:NAD(+)/NADH kinase [Abditibacteriales bacterium]MDW8366777.1 NAD(+)/NADH kinase [Abditibacteriales bacterium]
MSFRSVGIITALHRQNALEAARALVAFLEARFIVVKTDRACAGQLRRPDLGAAREQLAAMDLVVVLGGDGTVLGAARDTAPHGTPLLAVDLGTFGFLSEVKAENLHPALECVLRGEFRLEERHMVQATIVRDGREIASSTGLNDAVITRGALSRMIRLQAFINGQYVALYPADGIIVATPTGSTAYSLSAGGPIIHPSVNVLILTPICPHTLFTRPLIISASEEVRIVAHWHQQHADGEEVMLTVDGQVGIWLHPGDEVVVRQADHPARLVKLGRDTFYERLREKLQWGGEGFKG